MKSFFKALLSATLRPFLIAFFATLGVLIVILAISAAQDESQAVVIGNNPQWKKIPFGVEAPTILRIPISGVVGAPQVNANALNEVLSTARNDFLKGKIKGIILDIDSPGGSALESAVMYDALKSFKEQFNIPIYAYTNSIMASGGYYIACAADKIYASQGSVIGSIGVIAQYFNFYNALESIGVQSKCLYQGKGKTDMNPFVPETEEAKKREQAMIDQLYEQFVDVVITARKTMSKERLMDEYGAQVFLGKKAMDLKYIDELKPTFQDAVSALCQDLNIIPNSVRVIEINTRNWWQDTFSTLQSSPLLTGKVEHGVSMPESVKLSLTSSPYFYLYEPLRH